MSPVVLLPLGMLSGTSESFFPLQQEQPILQNCSEPQDYEWRIKPSYREREKAEIFMAHIVRCASYIKLKPNILAMQKQGDRPGPDTRTVRVMKTQKFHSELKFAIVSCQPGRDNHGPPESRRRRRQPQADCAGHGRRAG